MDLISFINRYNQIQQSYFNYCYGNSFVLYDVYFKKKQNNQKAF